MKQGSLFTLTEEWEKHWQGMPSFEQEDLTPDSTLTLTFREGDIHVHFENGQDRADFERLLARELSSRAEGGKFPAPADLGREWFSKLTDQVVNETTRSLWFPEAEIGSYAGKSYVSSSPLLPRWPIYIPSKGRSDSRHTMRVLEKIGVPYIAVVEPQEAELYLRAGVPEPSLLVLPFSNRGLVPTRNWIWDHARDAGHRYFWTMDDNLQVDLYRLTRNLKTPVGDGTILRVIEDFAERYENLPLCGMNYFMFASRKTKMPPVYLNARVYSNMLIQTDYRDPRGNPYRNEGRYNDDTDLNLRILKDGNCTVLFNTFLIRKATTMTVKGGIGYKRSEVKEEDDRWIASEELRKKHPDVTTVVHKWGRWHHQVDYSSLRGNVLRLRPGVEVPEGTNDYGMTLRVEEVAKPYTYRQLKDPADGPVGKPGKPARTVHVHFETEEDIREFGKLLDQRLSSGTKECWWPKVRLN